jgi:hypothetical protein
MLGVAANSDSPRRPRVAVGQVRVSADDYGATMTGTQRPTQRGQGHAVVVAGERRPIPLPARRVCDPLSAVAEAGHPAPEGFEYTGRVQVGSCCLA